MTDWRRMLSDLLASTAGPMQALREGRDTEQAIEALSGAFQPATKALALPEFTWCTYAPVCDLCGQKIERSSELHVQDTGAMVHRECANQTFWHVGDKVVHRFWQVGQPIGVVLQVRRVKGKYRPRSISNETREGIVEWVVVAFPYEVKEYAAWDIRQAPEGGEPTR